MPPSDSAGPAEFSIPFPLDEKPTFYDEEAELTKLKDGRTALALKAENAVDMETGAIVAVTTHGGAAADPTTIQETVIEAAIAVAELIAEPTPEGECSVHLDGVPLKFALALGLEPSQMIKCSTRAFNGPVQETYFHPITLILFDGKVEYEAEVGFSAGLDQDGCALLGFEGFFDRCVVKFDGPARTFEVSPTRPEDVKA